MIERTLLHWRELPHLRVAECAEIAGVCIQTIEAELPKMETRTIGRIRFVTTESFRRWLGEDVQAIAEQAAASREAKREAKRVMSRLG